jgi:type VI secretion system protein ImpG
MKMDDALYKAYLAELESLEKFRMGYTALHPHAPLGREDQDVRRLIEAMAVFSARTRLAGQRSLARSTLRLFRQHFSYMLNPMPAMAMLRAVPSQERRFVDPQELPRGTRVVLSSSNPRSSTPPLTFQTLAPLRLFPIRLARVDAVQREELNQRLLTFETYPPRVQAPSSLRLYINHLNEFRSSLAVYYQLRESLRAASVLFDEDFTEGSVGQPVTVRFGAPPPALAELAPFEHPLQRLCTFFHFPHQELFLELRLPNLTRRWGRFTVCLDLKEPWPSELVLSRDTFVLHAVPMVNLQQEMAAPLEHDGTRERHALVHSDPNGGYRVHSMLGVYLLQGKAEQPLRPGAISGGPDTYEYEHEGQGPERRTWLSLDLPGAFAQPVRVAADASWYQPLPPDFEASGLQAGLAGRFLEGLKWQLLGSPTPSMDNRLEHSHHDLLRLLSLRNQRFLDKDELLFLLEALGVRQLPHFRPVLEQLSSVDSVSKPFARSATGFKYIYRLTFRELDPLELPVIDVLANQLQVLLKTWSTEDVVDLTVRLPHLNKELHYPREAEQ